MTLLVGLLNLVGLLFWICLMLFLYAAGGGRSWNPTVLFLYCGPLVYFSLCLISTFPSARSFMGRLGLLANLALVPFLGTFLFHGGGWNKEGLIFGLPFLGLTALWYVAYRVNRRRDVA